ncbi:MAG: hypothetical protein HY674_20490, partial [Chloroflexi bacterium]|nr:hypothetical protein [Chloroflexota bacterium]
MNKIPDMTLIKNGWLWAAGLAAMTLALPMSLAKEVALFETFSNANMASAGIGGLRNVGRGTIELAGVSGTVTKALLYWHGPVSTQVEIPTATVSLNGDSVEGTSLGLSSPNCHEGYAYSQAFRADVTLYVMGNGIYELSDFNPLANDVNGASLIVFFDDGNDSNNRDYVVFDGNDSNNENTIDADGWNVAFSSVNYVSGDTVSLHLHVSDGQTFEDAALILNGATLV